MVVKTNCKWCGSNVVNILSDYCDSFVQVTCSNCGVSGPKIRRLFMGFNVSKVPLKDATEKAIEGWNEINKREPVNV